MSEQNGGHPTHDDAFWVGYFAQTIKQALGFRPLEASRFILESALREFIQSPASAGLEISEEEGKWSSK